MINRENEITKLYNLAEYSVDLNMVHTIVDELIDIIQTLECIVEEAIDTPKGVDPHSWSDYKLEKGK